MSSEFLSANSTGVSNCKNCNSFVDVVARFCGNCGISVVKTPADSFNYYTLSLHEEINDTVIHLLREKILFILLAVAFVSINIIGIYMSLKCYYEYSGEDTTRMVMAFTPLLYVNMSSLVCLQPLKRIRFQIRRFQDKLSNLNTRIKLEKSYYASQFQ